MAGNGVDLGAVITMLAELQTQMRQGFGTLDAKFGALDAKVGALDAKVGGLDVKFGTLRGEFDQLRDDTRHGLEDLRQTVDFYHQAVIGHGVTLSEQDERLRKLEAQSGSLPAAT